MYCLRSGLEKTVQEREADDDRSALNNSVIGVRSEEAEDIESSTERGY